MSLLTKATIQSYRPRGPQAMAVLGLILLSAGITVLLLLQVQLRLAIKNMEIETPKLQKRQEALLNELAQLNGEIEDLKDANRVLEYARTELGMVAYNPAEAQTLRVAPERIQAWRQCQPYETQRPALSFRREVAIERIEASGKQSLQTIMTMLRTPSAEAP